MFFDSSYTAAINSGSLVPTLSSLFYPCQFAASTFKGMRNRSWSSFTHVAYRPLAVYSDLFQCLALSKIFFLCIKRLRNPLIKESLGYNIHLVPLWFVTIFFLLFRILWVTFMYFFPEILSHLNLTFKISSGK